MKFRWMSLAKIFFYLCATLEVVRVYLAHSYFLLDMDKYLQGTERQPFQSRILASYLIRFIQWTALRLHHPLPGIRHGIAAMYLIDAVALMVSGWFVQKIYRLYSEGRALDGIVYPMFLAAFYFSYDLHAENNFSYPYDGLSIAFFAAVLYFILSDRFLPILLILPVATFNRETTLFLVVWFALHQAVTKKRLRDWKMWAQTALLLMIWAAIYLGLKHHFAGNDQSGVEMQMWKNLRRLRNPMDWPILLNIVGYMLPWVAILHRRLPRPMQTLLWILPLWFAVMLRVGLLVETRIYGELAPYTAVAVVLLLERAVADSRAAGRLQTAG